MSRGFFESLSDEQKKASIDHRGDEDIGPFVGSKEEFCARFKAEMLRFGPTFDDGASIAEYADETGPTYWDDPQQRAEGPEACAQADMSYWGED